MADFENPNDTDSVKEIMIDPAEFDATRVVIHDPFTSSFKLGGADISTTVSKGYYLDDEGNECKLYFSGPPQTCFGPQYQYEMNVGEDDKDPSKAKGVQVQYPITSMQSIATPTPTEQAFQDLIQSLWDLSLQKGKEEMAMVPDGEDVNPEDYIRIPQVSYSSFVTAAANKRWTNALKVPFEHPKDQKSPGKKTIDTTKPKRMYVKLKTTGKGDKMRVLTPFYGPGDVTESPLKYLEQRGVITPCFEWDGIYWGGHGQQPHGASLRFKIVEALFVPIAKSGEGLPKHRMLPKNTAAVTDDFASVAEDSEEPEDGTFAAPGSGDSRSALAKVAKANTTGKTPAPKGSATGKAAPKIAPKGKTVAPKAKVVAPKTSAPAKPAAKVVAKAKAVVPKAKAVVPKAKAVVAPPKAKVTKPKAKPVPVEEPEDDEVAVEEAEEDEVEEDEVAVEEDAEAEDA